MSKSEKAIILISFKMQRILDFKPKSKCIKRIRKSVLSDLGHEIESLTKLKNW